MRQVFLWAARNAWLREHLPQYRFMKRAVRRLVCWRRLGAEGVGCQTKDERAHQEEFSRIFHRFDLSR